MNRLAKSAAIGGALIVIGAILCVGTLYVATGGQIVSEVQTALIRLTLLTRQDDLNRSISADTSPLRFTVNIGDTPRAIARNLAASGLIADENLFVDYVRAERLDTELEAGTYFLNQAQSTAQIAVALTDSSSSQFPFRILEGWRMEEVAAIIDTNPYFGFSGADFLQVVSAGAQVDPNFAAFVGLPTGASLEGYLFPDTYQLPAQITPVMLRDTLLQEFLDNIGTDIPSSASAQGLTIHQIVTLASIIQREAVHADEHPMIASVYRNRMAIGMKLDADPTVQYAIGFKNGSWWPPITQADYSGVISPYNTYLGAGLPPGPIANPGITAIRAAANPAPSNDYYFRATCDGTGYHTFAATYEQHIANACP